MNLLLLLSALLSAITGIGGSVRAPDAVQVTAGQATVAVARSICPRSAHRPVQGIAPLAAVAVSVVAPIWPLAPFRPIWASRRRE
ncbi:hypothetical protein ASG67_05650 [Sphingomonas sp. Leaf339]|uniref:hypothetical protein n=1 Tax=Sphingomonas sp. Leaf339 TaxID=1736343 RepID=UPI0006F1E51A|nr:hypothetical protein [Sphingomonas sp. Leaf339]KQU55630.1 hypothetical protein ASG67_05650 [Sphingomonas sp. Leaf339]